MAATSTRSAPAKPRARRSHAERREETRARIEAAVIEAIHEVGLPRTTGAEIAQRAGVTWGAVQHHYGDKRGILVAVLERSTTRFIEQLEAVPVEGRSLAERVHDFVERAWEHFSSPDYRCTAEILLYLSGDDAQPDLPRTLAELQGPSWSQAWKRIFHDARLPRPRAVALQRYVASVLSGLSGFRILEGADERLREIELGFLEDTLLAQLDAEATAPEPPAAAEPEELPAAQDEVPPLLILPGSSYRDD